MKNYLSQYTDSIEKRIKREEEAVALADWMIDTECTVAQLEKEFMIPHSTVHRRLVVNLKEVDEDKYQQCRRILESHKNEALSRAAKARIHKKYF